MVLFSTFVHRHAGAHRSPSSPEVGIIVTESERSIRHPLSFSLPRSISLVLEPDPVYLVSIVRKVRNCIVCACYIVIPAAARTSDRLVSCVNGADP